ncbi:hypothetical protein DFQ28_009257 [Apophysomyces sp. BC1034]|nr:hypothetical protein DFQ30_001164 [Apophysomyces sp. BC1015]KAG0174266.1 hypothetical protein DFQ29_007555 [Apophysomyces sp. BC1021]KAG0185488.1 hypothetical protein DFQ28_009257 [Apophysomyces sp. BC1034]
MADHSEQIAQFIAMTGATPSRAQFFLESSNWDLDLAASQFYDSAGDGPSSQASEETAPPAQESPASSSAFLPSKGRSFPSSIKKNTVRTLNDIGSNDQNDESDEEHRESFYTGGEKSGMVVQGPNKRDGNNVVDSILKKAAEGGSMPEEDDNNRSPQRPSYFTGSGYKLGSEEEPSSLITPSASSAAPEEPSEPVTRYLTFWRNGFSVDDGPLYRYDDPANEAMLNAINSGRAPLSLLNVSHGQPVDVRVARRQDEDYTPPPKAPPKPFEGAGHRLGSPVVGLPSTPPGAYPSTSSPAALPSAPQVNENEPTTSLQIRLGDGTRLVAKFNHTHTVADIRQHIEANRPSERAFILQTTFPVKELTNEQQTLKEAGLLNSVIVQRYQ